ncbi:SdrD B-like domain-containing protein [Belnapia sp. F-4-1]|uniref:SdrD B-like domain-containing protein n=1 Tax=Belnapia sp. F-4-1 TaxID=1545443 RepID=UPI0005BBEA5C|nr:SdrD B-like domain-containing protein [Belnapia sp. F-4-1]
MTIGDRVWVDANGNGVQDGGEQGLAGVTDLGRDAGLYIPPKIGGTVSLDLPPGICDYKRPDAVFAGVTVELRDADGRVVRTTATGSDGTYLFENLVPGTYSVAFVAPAGTHFIKGVPESGLRGSIATVSGDAFTHVDAALSHLTRTIFDQPPTVLTSSNAYDANTAVNIPFEGAGHTNLNAPGSYVVGGHGGLTASSNQAGQYIIGGAGDNLLHGGSNGATLGGNVLVGGAGNNAFEATSGNDIVLGGCGANNMQGLGTVGAGAPRGLAGFDILVGGLSADVVEGNNSTAVMLGGGGGDQIHGDGTIIGGTNDGTISHADGVFSNFRIGDHLEGGGAANTFVYQKGDGVHWIENYHPGQGDSLQIYGYAAPTATGTVNGFTVLYFGPDDALVFNSAAPTENVTYFAHQDSAPGAYGRWAPLPPTLLAAAVTLYTGTQGDDIAIGSSSGNALDNQITGNALPNWLMGQAGSDTLEGLGGGDVLHGGSGADSFVSGRGTGQDVVGDFTLGEDRLLLKGFGLASFADVEAHMTEANGSTIIDLGQGDGIRLHGVANAALTAADFLYA